MQLNNAGRFALRVALPAVVITTALYFTFLGVPGIRKAGSLKPPHPPAEEKWAFDYDRDGRNYGLTDSQCEAAFPNYGHEIDRAMAHRRYRPVELSEMNTDWRDDGILRALIYSNQLFIISEKKVQSDTRHRPRSLAVLGSMYRAITAYSGNLPDIEFTITLHDEAARVGTNWVQHTTWAFTRQASEEQLWLMPDFNFWGWDDVLVPSYSFMQASVSQQDDRLAFKDKKRQLAWRGSLAVGPRRRKHLVELSDGKDWSNVQTVDWKNATDLRSKWLTIEDHCEHQFVAQTEGHSYSGRMKFLLNCRSVLMAHELRWIENYHHMLKPSGLEQNYVQLKDDFSDLPEKMEYYLAHTDEAERIARNSVEVFRRKYLSPAAEACYWRKLFRGWAEVSFKPSLYENVTETDEASGGTRTVQRVRGKPFEGFVISETVETPLPAKAHLLCEFHGT